jgi:hypothetical protein
MIEWNRCSTFSASRLIFLPSSNSVFMILSAVSFHPLGFSFTGSLAYLNDISEFILAVTYLKTKQNNPCVAQNLISFS